MNEYEMERRKLRTEKSGKHKEREIKSDGADERGLGTREYRGACKKETSKGSYDY